MVSVGVCLHFFIPTLYWYAGLSGALYGLYITAAYSAIKQNDYFIGIGVGLLTIGKVAMDYYYGGTFDNAALIEARVVTEAHNFGVLSALALVAIDISYRFIKHKKSQ